jgi:hypothetical protein
MMTIYILVHSIISAIAISFGDRLSLCSNEDETDGRTYVENSSNNFNDAQTLLNHFNGYRVGAFVTIAPLTKILCVVCALFWHPPRTRAAARRRIFFDFLTGC